MYNNKNNLMKSEDEVKKLLLSVGAALIASTATLFASGHGAHWGYVGHEGPKFWGDLDPAYKMCKLGKNQSPIDINERDAVKACLKPVKVYYRGSADAVVNNGHTIKVKVEGRNFVVVDGKKFYLKQFHFHAPSEHTVNGKYYPFEAHFVHLDKDGNITVLGVFFKLGKENEELAKIWKKMPEKVGEKERLRQRVNLEKLLPKNRDYYRYNGSLTTPPCSEGVRWIVFKEPLELSKEQLNEFKKVMGVDNNRPVQPLNARKVLK